MTPSTTGRFANFIVLLLVGRVALIGGAACAEEVGPHVGVGVIAGSAPGLDDGGVHFGGFVPLAQPDAESVVFFDGSLLLFNEGSSQLGANLGLGSRSYCDATGTILGGYAYYDRRDRGAFEFDQVGVGVESLGRLFDARLNVNTPVGERTHGADRALATIDGELGALLANIDDAQLRAFLGLYSLHHGTIDDTAGVRGRAELQIADQCFAGWYLEHDELFDTTGGFTLEFRFGSGGSPAGEGAHSLLARLSDPVGRRKHVMITDSNEAGAPGLGTLGGPTTPTTTPTTPTTPTTVDPGRGPRGHFVPRIRDPYRPFVP